MLAENLKLEVTEYAKHMYGRGVLAYPCDGDDDVSLSPFLLQAMICSPCLFVPPIGFLCIFTRLLTCPCMSLAC